MEFQPCSELCYLNIVCTISNISMDIDKVEQAIGRQDERLNDKISSTMDIVKFNQNVQIY